MMHLLPSARRSGKAFHVWWSRGSSSSTVSANIADWGAGIVLTERAEDRTMVIAVARILVMSCRQGWVLVLHESRETCLLCRIFVPTLLIWKVIITIHVLYLLVTHYLALVPRLIGEIRKMFVAGVLAVLPEESSPPSGTNQTDDEGGFLW